MRVSGLTLALFVAGSIATLTQTQPGQPAPGVPAPPGQRTPARATPRASDPTGTAIMRGQVTSTDGTRSVAHKCAPSRKTGNKRAASSRPMHKVDSR